MGIWKKWMQWRQKNKLNLFRIGVALLVTSFPFFLLFLSELRYPGWSGLYITGIYPFVIPLGTTALGAYIIVIAVRRARKK